MRVIPLSTGTPDAVPAGDLSTSAFEAALHAAHEHAAAQRWDALGDGGPDLLVRRWDAAGLAPAATLTDRIRAILETPYPAADGLDPRIIPQRQWTPVGYEKTEIMRFDISGTVKNARSHGNVPMVDVTGDTETFDVAHYVCGFRLSMWERQSVLNQILSVAGLRASAARTIQAREASERTWHGDQVSGLPGVIGHPYLPVSIGAVDYTDPMVTADAILADFTEAADMAADLTGDVGVSTKVVVASKIQRVLARRFRGTGTNQTIWQAIQETHPQLEIVLSHTLNGSGPSGEHGMLFYNGQDADCLFNDVVQPTTFLAPQTNGFDDVVYVYMSHAGVKMFNAHHNHLRWVPTA